MPEPRTIAVNIVYVTQPNKSHDTEFTLVNLGSDLHWE
jgi:hypothetical protein